MQRLRVVEMFTTGAVKAGNRSAVAIPDRIKCVFEKTAWTDDYATRILREP